MCPTGPGACPGVSLDTNPPLSVINHQVRSLVEHQSSFSPGIFALLDKVLRCRWRGCICVLVSVSVYLFLVILCRFSLSLSLSLSLNRSLTIAHDYLSWTTIASTKCGRGGSATYGRIIIILEDRSGSVPLCLPQCADNITASLSLQTVLFGHVTIFLMRQLSPPPIPNRLLTSPN